MVVTLKPERENWLTEEAEREGVSPEEIVRRAAETRWAVAHRAPRLSGSESKLLEKINEGFPEEFWQRFRELREELNAGTIEDAEYQEYLHYIEETETRNVERLESLLQLSQLRGVTLQETMNQLGIAPVKI